MLKMMTMIGVSTLMVATAAAAQDHAGHQMGAARVGLPSICTGGQTGTGEQPPAEISSMSGMDAAHEALMGTMEPMHSDMMTGMMAEDLDVAFVCGMIPHHQGAIDMARVELEHGDDEWAKQMAQRIIDAQEAEIAEMIEWLEGQAAQ